MAISRRWLSVCGAAGAVLVLAGGCTRSDREAAERRVEETADQTAAEARRLRDAAAETAKSTRQQVGAAAKVAGDEVADALVELKVKAALLDKLGVDGLRIAVEAKGGDVVLQGVVKTESTAKMAADIAKGVDGVAAVEPTIVVQKDPGGTVIDKQVDRVIDKTQAEIADALLETRVKTRLVEEMGRGAFAIEVEAENGVVSLTGTVPDAIRRDLAVQTAAKTTGAARVVDQLSVSG